MKRNIFIIVCLISVLCFVFGCTPNNNTEDENKNNGYTITFINDGVTSTQVYNQGESVSFPIASKEGYNFLGWSYEGGTVYEYVVEDHDVIFTAVYEEADCFDAVRTYLKNIIPSTTDKDIELPTSYNGVIITWRSSKPYVINKNGLVSLSDVENDVTLYATLNYNGQTEFESFEVTVPRLNDKGILVFELSKFKFNDDISSGKLDLKQSFATTNSPIETVWTSSHPEIIDTLGNIISYPTEDVIVTLSVTLTLREEIITKEFYVEFSAKSIEELIETLLAEMDFSTNVTNRVVNLPVEFAYNIVGKWESSDETILTSDGVVKTFNENKNVKMTLTYWYDGDDKMNEKEFDFNVFVETGNRIVRASEFNENNMSGVELKDSKLVLSNAEVYGEYESDVIETIDFTSLVGSWAATSSENATVQFFVKVRVNGTWSDYLKYSNSGWGLGLKNAASDHSNSLAELSTDEVMVLNGKSADAVMFKLILRRTSSAYESPKVSLAAFALKGTTFAGLTYSMDELPDNVKYDVPKLYQQVVPTIGNSICSATSTTMLLKYKGMDFTKNDSLFEHRYMASIVRDYGNGIYGNWVYNTVTMGGYGFDAYVARLYSAYELAYHLANVGPVAISVKGQMTSDQKNYYTSGHLLCIIGYTYEDGVLTFIANDPNVSVVECRYSLSVINSTWRNIIYVIE